MSYAVPRDRFPKPALPTEEEARLAAAALIASQLPGWTLANKRAISDQIYDELIEPLLTSAQEWQRRAVERRHDFSNIVDRMRVIRDAVLDHQGAPPPPDSRAIQYRTEDGA
jgi:hypothetical protein